MPLYDPNKRWTDAEVVERTLETQAKAKLKKANFTERTYG